MIDAGIRYPFDTPPETGEAVRVAEGVLWLRLPLPMALDHVNIYALDDGDGWTILDTGFDSRKTRAIWESLLAGPLTGKPVRRVVVTHHHPDHVGLAGWFADQGIELAMPRTAWLTARMLVLDEQASYPARTLDFYHRNGMASAMLATRQNDRPFNFADCVAPLPLGFTRLVDGGTIRMGGRTWDIRFGDGHAPDHATFWSRDDNLVIGGDQLLSSISPNIGVYATEPDADPLAEWLESCTRLATFARSDQLVLCGHKLPFTGLPTRMRQLSENHHSALDRLLDLLRTPKRGGDCFAALFKREIGAAEYGLAFAEAVAHLNHLLANGRLTRTPDRDGVWLWETAL